MGKDDQDHFKQYTPQNRVKHAILEKYFGAYLRALQRVVSAFHYIDGFAGGGTYINDVAGSPLIAVQLLEDQPLPFSVTYIEKDPKLFATLNDTVLARPRSPQLVGDPTIKLGEFSDHLDIALNLPIYGQYSKVATFAFIDPCGASGVLMDDIQKILSRPFAECLLFWNYDGINRWLGGLTAGTHPEDRLRKLFGNHQLLAQARDIISSNRPGEDKERNLLSLFLEALRGSRAKFTVPFRIEARDRDRTSHYLIHCSGHNLAFKIMKDVMGGLSNVATEAGSFEFSSAARTRSLFTPTYDTVKAAVLAELKKGPRRVGLFTEQWILRPDDYYREKDYKELLLNLETAGEIEVVAKDWRTPAPRASRRAGKGGAPTLGNDLVIRLSSEKSAT